MAAGEAEALIMGGGEFAAAYIAEFTRAVFAASSSFRKNGRAESAGTSCGTSSSACPALS